MKIVVYHCGDIFFCGDVSPTDRKVLEIDSWESLIAVVRAPIPEPIGYPIGAEPGSPEHTAWQTNCDKTVEIVAPIRAVLAALENRCRGGPSWADNSHGYYSVVEE